VLEVGAETLLASEALSGGLVDAACPGSKFNRSAIVLAVAN
jgi:hypothetical protein